MLPLLKQERDSLTGVDLETRRAISRPAVLLNDVLKTKQQHRGIRRRYSRPSLYDAKILQRRKDDLSSGFTGVPRSARRHSCLLFLFLSASTLLSSTRPCPVLPEPLP